jgi:hypothetical protein
MREPLEVLVGRRLRNKILLLYAVLGPIAALAVFNAYNAMRSKSPSGGVMTALWIGGALFMLGIPLFLVVVQRKRVVRLDERGVVLRNGRTFAWSDFAGVEPRFIHHKGVETLNHYDLVFHTGRAGVFHRLADNQDEVERVITAIMKGDNPFVR